MKKYLCITKFLVFVIILFLFKFNLIQEVSSASESKDSWVIKSPMSSNRVGHGVVSCNGRIYVVGGYNKSGFLDSVESYDPVNDTWETKTPMPHGRAEFGICTIEESIYVIGGCHTLKGKNQYIYPANVLNSVIVYDTNLDTWTYKSPMPTPRVSLDICAVDNKIYAIGGAKLKWNDCCYYLYNAIGSNEIYNPINDTWEILPSMINPRHHIKAACIGDNIFVCGGNKGTDMWQPENIVDFYSISFKTWENTTSHPLNLTGFGITTFNDKLFTIGGLSFPEYHINHIFEYDPINKQWQNVSSMPTTRYGLGVCTFNNKVYAIGGAVNGLRSIYSEKNQYLTDNEEFTPPPSDITPKPNVYILFPKENASIKDPFNITGTASINTGAIKIVQIKIDSESWNIAKGTNNWIFKTGNLTEGNHTISARSYDGLRFSDIKTIDFKIQNIEKSDEESETPGFECILTICAIFLFLLYKWKKIR
jgi:N-acetylneuraminic acid mutarotase